MVCSQTGSGKTLAYLVPLLHLLRAKAARRSGRSAAPRAVVLAPTRELASQIAKEATSCAGKDVLVACIFGGVPYRESDLVCCARLFPEDEGKQELHHGADLLVATPGRLEDACQRGDVQLRGWWRARVAINLLISVAVSLLFWVLQVSQLFGQPCLYCALIDKLLWAQQALEAAAQPTAPGVQVAVLDEADRLLDLGFEEQIRLLLTRRMPPTGQGRVNVVVEPCTGVQHLAADFLDAYTFVAVGRVGSAANTEPSKPKALLGTLLGLESGAAGAVSGAASAVVFVNTKDAARLVERKLRGWKFRRLVETAMGIHGSGHGMCIAT
eukprot:Skav215886  [mRNA]  locus=scaffold956:125173:129915:- [translate_table: standard]